MTKQTVHIRELAGWDLDEYQYRPSSYDQSKPLGAQTLVARRTENQLRDAFLEEETRAIENILAPHALRPDLQAETAGLEWSLGVIDLRFLIAFQRRIAFEPSLPSCSTPKACDWNAHIGVCFPAPKIPSYDALYESDTRTLVLRSSDPNLGLRRGDDLYSPLTIHTGSPFFEVAHYEERWFLRDGYHRAYSLLRANIFKVPALVVHARNLKELGATRPWFFKEETLLSATPPRVIDFLDDALVIEYTRPPLIKTIRVTIEESLVPATSPGDQA
jgi:hypothetical protein